MLPYKFKFRRILAKYISKVGQYESVIDIACADGKLRPFFEGKSYVGIDMSSEAIMEAKKKYPLDSFHLLRLPNSKIKNLGKFDLVVSTHTFAHFKEEEKEVSFRQFLSCSKRSSHIILQLSSSDWTKMRDTVLATCNVLACKKYRGLFSTILIIRERFHTTKIGFYLSNILSFFDWGNREVMLLLTLRDKE